MSTENYDVYYPSVIFIVKMELDFASPTLIGAFAAILTAAVSFVIGKRRSKTSEFSLLIKANEQFRTEVRGELAEARKTIEVLQLAMKDKDREIAELQTSMNNLYTEIVEKDRKISDLKLDILRKDIKVAELASRVSSLDQK